MNTSNPKLAIALVAMLALAPLTTRADTPQAAALPRTAAPAGVELYFISPEDGATDVASSFA